MVGLRGRAAESINERMRLAKAFPTFASHAAGTRPLRAKNPYIFPPET